VHELTKLPLFISAKVFDLLTMLTRAHLVDPWSFFSLFLFSFNLSFFFISIFLFWFQIKRERRGEL
jgi:hypothetical protein